MSLFTRRAVWTIALAICLGWSIRSVSRLDERTRLEVIRKFNKRRLNPFAIWIAARRPMYYGVLHHTGRRSGRTYDTPVEAKLTTEGVIIPLPYGTHTDWLQNVLASDRCSLTLNGQTYTFIRPQIIPASVAEPLVPPANATVWRRVGIRNYLSMKTDIPVAAAAEKTLAAQ
jgi:deazaflavin-dependent oxidoreductase (nitroreductase family)